MSPPGHATGSVPELAVLSEQQPHTFIVPVKRINEGPDVDHFLRSCAYRDIGNFITQLNHALCPKKDEQDGAVKSFQIDDIITHPAPVLKLRSLLKQVEDAIQEAPPDTGPRRFGNVSFRRWHELVEARARDLLTAAIDSSVLDYKTSGGVSALDELLAYFLGSFGSAQRLDFGTGHELSFVAFLAGLWKLRCFQHEGLQREEMSRSIIFGVIEPYLNVIRKLILTYTLEPAGSHGVWGLDDHFFIPYILGSAQYCPAIALSQAMPLEGSLPGVCRPDDITQKAVVDRERQHNMYFAAIGFINDVKTGVFWEHSPILFDISGVRHGWGKINKGMIKMYNAEVLSKFPVVQHFPFGLLLSWDIDPTAEQQKPSLHTSVQPRHMHEKQGPTERQSSHAKDALETAATAAPWARASGGSGTTSSMMPPTRAPWADASKAAQTHGGKGATEQGTRAPWAR